MTTTIEVVVQRECAQPGVPDDASIAGWAQAACAVEHARGELVVRIVDAGESQALNRDYRGKDKPTNVLSFPAEWPVEADDAPLGDIVICAPVVRREAREQGKTERDHWAHMVVHGCLHILGYDHIEPDEAERMEALETAVLKQFKISNPYE